MRTRSFTPVALVSIALIGWTTRAAADLPPLEMSSIVSAPPKMVWDAFTTTEGAKSWMVAQADIEMKLGAVWKTKYGPQGTLGDEGTIFNELLAFDPGRMFCIRIQKPPKGFPFMNSYRDMWTVVYFEPVEGGKTRVTLRAHGFKDSDESRRLRSFFEAGNRQTLDMLAKHFEKAVTVANQPYTGRARDVLPDGTLVVERRDVPGKEEKVRLWGIGLPTGEQPFRKEAISRLRDLTVGLEVHVTPKGPSSDSGTAAIVYSRDASFLYPEMGTGAINYILLRDGLATRDESLDKSDPLLARHEATARLARRAIWSSSPPRVSIVREF